jgi:glutathione S-transferase
MANECQTPAFKKLNPNAKIPLLLLSNGQTISESNAIINYLAVGSELLPTDPFTLAKVQQWQFFEQYSHEPFIAVARFINKYLGLPKDRQQDYISKQEGGHKALRIMEEQLKKTDYLVNNKMTMADISLFAYTHVAPEGGVLLDTYPYIRAWITRIEAYKGYINMG